MIGLRPIADIPYMPNGEFIPHSPGLLSLQTDKDFYWHNFSTHLLESLIEVMKNQLKRKPYEEFYFYRFYKYSTCL
jgi:hypothetical protein